MPEKEPFSILQKVWNSGQTPCHLETWVLQPSSSVLLWIHSIKAYWLPSNRDLSCHDQNKTNIQRWQRETTKFKLANSRKKKKKKTTRFKLIFSLPMAFSLILLFVYTSEWCGCASNTQIHCRTIFYSLVFLFPLVQDMFCNESIVLHRHPQHSEL